MASFYRRQRLRTSTERLSGEVDLFCIIPSYPLNLRAHKVEKKVFG